MTTGEGSVALRIPSALLEAHPSWEELRVSYVASLPSTGWESDLFTCTVKYIEDCTRKHHDLIIKAYLGESALGKARNEYEGMKQLNAAGYPVPEVFAFDPGDPPGVKPFVVMERVDGRTLTDAMRDAPVETQSTLISRFCELFVRLHSLDWRPFVANPDEYTLEGSIARSVDTAESYIVRFGRDEFEPVLPWLRERAAIIECERLSVCHWDYHPSNLILKPDGTLVVLDWSGAQVLDYRFDLGWTLMLIGSYRGSGPRDLIMREYERFAGGPVKEVDFFEVFSAVNRLFDVTVSLSTGPESLSMRPEAVVQMRKNASALNYVYELLHSKTSITLPHVEGMLASLDS